MRLSQWVDRLMLTSVAAFGLFILGALAKQSAVEWVGVLLAITLLLGAYITWIRYRRVWFALYLGRAGPGISGVLSQEVAEEQSHAHDGRGLDQHESRPQEEHAAVHRPVGFSPARHKPKYHQ